MSSSAIWMSSECWHSNFESPIYVSILHSRPYKIVNLISRPLCVIGIWHSAFWLFCSSSGRHSLGKGYSFPSLSLCIYSEVFSDYPIYIQNSLHSMYTPFVFSPWYLWALNILHIISMHCPPHIGFTTISLAPWTLAWYTIKCWIYWVNEKKLMSKLRGNEP